MCVTSSRRCPWNRIPCEHNATGLRATQAPANHRHNVLCFTPRVPNLLPRPVQNQMMYVTHSNGTRLDEDRARRAGARAGCRGHGGQCPLRRRETRIACLSDAQTFEGNEKPNVSPHLAPQRMSMGAPSPHSQTDARSPGRSIARISARLSELPTPTSAVVASKLQPPQRSQRVEMLVGASTPSSPVVRLSCCWETFKNTYQWRHRN